MTSIVAAQAIEGPGARHDIGMGGMRRVIWRACSVAVNDADAWRRLVTDVFIALSLSQCLTILVAGWSIGSPWTLAAAGGASLLSVLAILARLLTMPMVAGFAVLTALVGQTGVLAMLCFGLPLQAEVNLVFVLVIAGSAAFLDLSMLIYTAAIVILVHFAFHAAAPGLLFPEGGGIWRGCFTVLSAASK